MSGSNRSHTGDHEANVIAELCKYPDGGGALVDHETETHAGDDVADEITQLRQHEVNHRDDQIAGHRHGVEGGIDRVFHQVVGVGPAHRNIRHAKHGIRRHQPIPGEDHLVGAVMPEWVVVVDGRGLLVIDIVEIQHRDAVDAAILVHALGQVDDVVAEHAGRQDRQAIWPGRIVVHVPLVLVGVACGPADLQLVPGFTVSRSPLRRCVSLRHELRSPLGLVGLRHWRAPVVHQHLVRLATLADAHRHAGADGSRLGVGEHVPRFPARDEQQQHDPRTHDA